jgi:hypothetical protein
MQEASSINPFAFGALLVLAYLVWSLPRRYAACPLLVMICLMPLGQELIIFGLHFYMFRLLLLVGAFRVMSRGEAAQLRLNSLDKLFIWWMVVSIVCGTLVKPSIEFFVNRLGEAYNAAGTYFFVRCVILDTEDIVASVRVLAFLSLPMAAFMLVEKATTHNLLSVFGGIPEITAVREGHLRCQGAFRHPILAGTFGAAQIPLFVALWFYRTQYRLLAMVATVASTIIVVTASSSGALTAFFAVLIGLALWKWHNHMRLIRRLVVVSLLLMTIVMNAPVWYVFAKMGDVMGGTGWHRAWLIDQTVRHFDEWWLFGTTYTAHWAPGGEVLPGENENMDITNQYIVEGVKGGLLRMLLFLAVIVRCFKYVGWRVHAEAAESPAKLLVWALGVSLFAHCLSFLSVSYFDQSIILWYWLLAVVCSVGPGFVSNPAPLGAMEETGSAGVPGEPGAQVLM